MAKKREATSEYLEELKLQIITVNDELLRAKMKLYERTADGKLFEPEFEEARLACIQAVKKLDFTQAEIKRVTVELEETKDALF